MHCTCTGYLKKKNVSNESETTLSYSDTRITAMEYQSLSKFVTKQSTSLATDFRALNKRNISYILTKRARHEDLLRTSLEEVKTNIIEEFYSFKREHQEKLTSVDEKEKVIKRLEYEMLTLEKSFTDKDVELNTITEALDKKQTESANLRRELDALREKHDRTTMELDRTKHNLRTLQESNKHLEITTEELKIEKTKSQSELKILQGLTTDMSREQFIEISVEDICRTVEKVQDTFHYRINTVTKALTKSFENQTQIFNQKEAKVFEEHLVQSGISHSEAIDKMRRQTQEEIMSLNEEHEKHTHILRQQHTDQIQAMQIDHAEQIKTWREKYENASNTNYSKEIQFFKEQGEKYRKRQLRFTQIFDKEAAENASLKAKINQLECKSEVASIQSTGIVVHMPEYEDVDEVRFQLDLYRKCISILERMDGISPVVVYRKDVESIWRKINQWDETQDVPDDIASQIENMEGTFGSQKQLPLTSGNNDATMFKESLYRNTDSER